MHIRLKPEIVEQLKREAEAGNHSASWVAARLIERGLGTLAQGNGVARVEGK